MHNAANVIRHVKVLNVGFGSQLKAVDALGPNVLPIDSNVIISVESVLHVMKSECMNELVYDGEESKAARLDFVGLEADSLRSSAPSHHRCTAHRIASDENVVGFIGTARKLQARLALEIYRRLVYVINLLTIYKKCAQKASRE